MIDGYDVGVVVNVLLEELRVTIVGTKSHSSSIVPDVNRRYARDGRKVLGVATRVAGARLINDARTKGMRPIQLAIGRNESRGVGKAATIGGWRECVLT